MSLATVAETAAPPVDPAPRADLAAMFRPRSIALVGASERSFWSNSVYGNLTRYGFAGAIHLINPKSAVVYGQPTKNSCRQIGTPVDLALLMVPQTALFDTLEDLHAAGIRNAVVLTAGFSETGAEGAALQDEVARRAHEFGIRLLGPNCLGFVNYADAIPVWTTPRRRQRGAGTVAMVSQSGAIATYVSEFTYRQSIPFRYLVSTGNECDVDAADVLDFFADDEGTKAIALFLESVRDGERFARAARKAHAAGKPIVVLKVGASEIGAAAAQAHTGSLVGNDRVFDAACRALGMVRVSSLEDLVFTADLLSRLPAIDGDGVGLAATSGGMCEIAADRAEALGLHFPPLSEAGSAALRAALPDFGTPRNPLDLTGGAMSDTAMVEASLAALAAEPKVALVLCLFDAPEKYDPGDMMSKRLAAIQRGAASQKKPVILFSTLAAPVGSEARAAEADVGAIYSGAGLDRAISVTTAAVTWWRRRREIAARAAAGSAAPRVAAKPMGEQAALRHLADHGVAVVPQTLVTNAAEAAAAAQAAGAPVAIKIASSQIAHKSDIGGVALNVDPAEASAVFDAMIARVAAAAPDARIDGALVAPMRSGALELFVGTLQDPVWGCAVSVGLGGIFVETLRDTALRLAPVTEADVLEMLSELRGTALLDGVRGKPAVDRAAIARAVVGITDAALALGPDLASLEVNPLGAWPDRAEALDALTVWQG